MSHLSRTWAGLLCGVMFLTTGCTTLHIPFLADRIPKATARNPVAQIICIWQPSEGRDPNGMPCRGFAGQILFLANRGSLPVQVNGDVRIYLFDDQGSAEEQAKPLHLYNFDSKSWAIHLTKGTLGPTYSVFVPYTRRGNYEAKCALRVRLTSEAGDAVFSDLATIALDGKKWEEKVREQAEPSFDGSNSATDAVSQMIRRTTTITSNGKTPIPSDGRVMDLPPTETSKRPMGRVQLASHEVGGEPADVNRQRVDQLEQLVQQLLEQQQQRSAQRPGGDVPAGETRPSKSATRLNDAPIAHDLDFPPHPLTSEAKTGHPLEDLDTAAAPPSQRTAAQSRRDPLAGHPLAAFDEELSREEFARKGQRPSPSQPVVNSRDESASPARAQHATEPTERRERSWSDPFEPINTEAMETTSLEPETIRRQRLRAAR